MAKRKLEVVWLNPAPVIPSWSCRIGILQSTVQATLEALLFHDYLGCFGAWILEDPRERGMAEVIKNIGADYSFRRFQNDGTVYKISSSTDAYDVRCSSIVSTRMSCEWLMCKAIRRRYHIGHEDVYTTPKLSEVYDQLSPELVERIKVWNTLLNL